MRTFVVALTLVLALNGPRVAWAQQPPANTVYAGPTIGSPAPPMFRKLIAGDFSVPVNFFANASTGSDSNDCLAATSGSGHGPCLTVQHALNVAVSYSAGNAPMQVNLAGNFTTGATVAGPVGFGAYNALSPGIILNGGNSATTSIDDTTASCGTLVVSGSGTNLILEHITLKKTAGCGGGGSTIFAQQDSVTAISTDMNFGTAGAQHIHAETNATVEISANYTISGSAQAHWGTSTGGVVADDAYTTTCTGALSFTWFHFADQQSIQTALNGTNFSGCGSVTGRRYNITEGSLLNADGNASYFSAIPGNAIGIVSSGGRLAPSPIATLGGCTNGALAAGPTDNSAAVTFSGASSSCAINFGLQKLNNPVCVGSNTAGTAMSVGTTVNGVTLTSSFVNSETAYVICRDVPE